MYVSIQLAQLLGVRFFYDLLHFDTGNSKNVVVEKSLKPGSKALRADKSKLSKYHWETQYMLGKLYNLDTHSWISAQIDKKPTADAS